MRCLALAQAGQDLGWQAVLATNSVNTNLNNLLLKEGVDIVHLDVEPGSVRDAVETAQLADRIQPAWIILDGYGFGGDFQAALKLTGRRLLVLDDYGHAGRYAADVILNQNLHAQEQTYAARESSTRLLLGPRFTLLRREFRAWRGWKRETPPNARKILVTLGGADPTNATLKVIHALRQLANSGLEAIVLSGKVSPHRPTLTEACRGWESAIRVREAGVDMPDLLAWADCAINAGGSTCWEMAFMGLPNLLLILADNQRQVATELARLGVSINLGEEAEMTPERIADSLWAVLNDAPWRRLASRKGRAVIDGQGAGRVLQVLCASDSPGCPGEPRLRPAAAEDAFALWTIANDPQTRMNAFQPASIPLEKHLDWYEARLASATCGMWVYDIDGAVAAQIRYDRTEEGVGEIGYAVAPSFRNRGLGKRILADSWPLACRQLGVNRIRGVVFEANIPSRRAFRSAGFQEMEQAMIQGHMCCVFEREARTEA
jgi:UDP-2,4-diacetamido-2,4,6-trideoxy-beta-L-altropyranose hydrolase